jgi:hypothetical protein
MKKISALFAISLLFAVFSANVFGQASATATATATIITPISIVNASNMNFGNIAVSGAGTVVLSPAGSRTTTGSITLPNVTGSVSAASFTVKGEGTSTFSITLPTTDYTITRNLGSETMIVNNFTSNPSGTGTLSAGELTLNVGARLNVNALQVPGTYTNAAGFTVTVNYN